MVAAGETRIWKSLFLCKQVWIALELDEGSEFFNSTYFYK